MARYKLRNMSQGKHPLEGTPQYEEMKAQELKAAKKAAKARNEGQATGLTTSPERIEL
jgi:hypothetical protein